MQDTDAVSCLLCLQADEYGSMIKVQVPPGRIPPSPERVVCRLCASIIAAVLDSQEGVEPSGRTNPDNDLGPRGGPDHDPSADDDPDRDFAVAEREADAVVEVDRSEPQDPTRGRADAEKGRVEG